MSLSKAPKPGLLGSTGDRRRGGVPYPTAWSWDSALATLAGVCSWGTVSQGRGSGRTPVPRAREFAAGTREEGVRWQRVASFRRSYF